MFQIKKAARSKSKMRIGLFGTSGSGKTYSALLLAKGLVADLSKVVVIDTENGSADLYSQLGDYSTLLLKPPYDPRRYIEAIQFCEKNGFECIVIDSISHEWEGVGGCLDIHSKLGGKFENWSKVTPLHQRFIDSIVASNCHIITTGRSKTDYAFEGKKDGGKGKVEKIGLKTVTREGFDYEMTVAFQINQEHLASVDKDRTNLFANSVPFLISEETGLMIREWNDKGEEIVSVVPVYSPHDEIFLQIKNITDNYLDKDKLNEILDRFGVKTSNEIKECNDENTLNDWLAILNEFNR